MYGCKLDDHYHQLLQPETWQEFLAVSNDSKKCTFVFFGFFCGVKLDNYVLIGKYKVREAGQSTLI